LPSKTNCSESNESKGHAGRGIKKRKTGKRQGRKKKKVPPVIQYKTKGTFLNQPVIQHRTAGTVLKPGMNIFVFEPAIQSKKEKSLLLYHI
jgi:hypothetical protein